MPLVAARAELAWCVTRRSESLQRSPKSETSTWRSHRHDDRTATSGLRAGDLAHVAEFFSFGSNDLTQTTWGFSPDDVEGGFFTTYLDAGIFSLSRSRRSTKMGSGCSIRMAWRRDAKCDLDEPWRLWRTRRRPGLGSPVPRLGARLRLMFTVPGPIARLEAGRAARRRRERHALSQPRCRVGSMTWVRRSGGDMTPLTSSVALSRVARAPGATRSLAPVPASWTRGHCDGLRPRPKCRAVGKRLPPDAAHALARGRPDRP